MTADARNVHLSRWFDAPREAVWAAFTEADQLARWYGPAGVSVDPASVSVGSELGGEWSLTMVAGTRRIPLRGTITQIEAPRRLVVTDAMPDGSIVTMTIDLTEEDGGTRLTLRQGPFPSEVADGAETAWSEAGDKLAAILRPTG